MTCFQMVVIFMSYNTIQNNTIQYNTIQELFINYNTCLGVGQGRRGQPKSVIECNPHNTKLHYTALQCKKNVLFFKLYCVGLNCHGCQGGGVEGRGEGQYDSINPLARRVPKYSHGPTPLARGASKCSHVVNICLQKAGDTPLFPVV